MKLYTSYFGNIKNIPPEFAVVSICGKAPTWYYGCEFKKLAPRYWFFKEWKENHNNDFYVENFNKEVLGELNAHEIICQLFKMTNKTNVVLLCYEKPEDFCHRHLVAKWFKENGYECEELPNGKAI